MPRERPMTPVDRVAALEANIARVLRGKPAAIRHAVIALIARGHLLIEDVPGVGKTTLARALARVDRRHVPSHPVHQRPAARPTSSACRSRPEAGAVRVPARAGLREPRARRRDQPHDAAHAERAAGGDERGPGLGRRPDLPARRAVPGDRDAEPRGALRHLPAARVADGSLPAAHPHRLPGARRRAAHPARVGRARPRTRSPRSSPCCRVADVRALQEAAERVHLSAELADYIVAVARETRRSPHLALGVSPRGAARLANAARAAALADGRDYVLPDDLKQLAGPCSPTAWCRRRPSRRWARARSDVERVLADIVDRAARAGMNGGRSSAARCGASATREGLVVPGGDAVRRRRCRRRRHQPLLPDVRHDGLPARSRASRCPSWAWPGCACDACCRRPCTRARPT